MATELLPTRGVFHPGDDVVVEVRGRRRQGRSRCSTSATSCARAESSAGADDGLARPAAAGWLRRRAGLSAAPWPARPCRCSAPRAGACATGSSPTTAPAATGAGRRPRPAAPPDRRAVLRLGVPARRSGRRRRAVRGRARQPVALATVRASSTRLGAAGASALGYAAVYAVGRGRVAALGARWPCRRLTARRTRSASSCGSSTRRRRLARALRRRPRRGGRRGRLRRLPPRPVRLPAAGGARTTDRRRRRRRRSSASSRPHVAACPTAAWCSTTSTTSRPGSPPRTPQDAVYIEVWPPHMTLGSLAAIVDPRPRRRRGQAGGDRRLPARLPRADARPCRRPRRRRSRWRRCSPTAPPSCSPARADGSSSTPTTCATTSPSRSTLELLRRWYDFLVEHDELLLDPALVDVTGAWAGAYNDDLDVTYAASPSPTSRDRGGSGGES